MKKEINYYLQLRVSRVVHGIEREMMTQDNRKFNQEIDRKYRKSTAGALTILKSTLQPLVSSSGLLLELLDGQFNDPHAKKTFFITLIKKQRILLCSVTLGCIRLLGQRDTVTTIRGKSYLTRDPEMTRCHEFPTIYVQPKNADLGGSTF